MAQLLTRSTPPQLDEHYLTPAAIASVEIHGATNTRRSFLDHVIKPLVTDPANSSSTLGEVLDRIGVATRKLSRFGVLYFLSPVEVYHDGFFLIRAINQISSKRMLSTSLSPKPRSPRRPFLPTKQSSMSRSASRRSPASYSAPVPTLATPKAQHTPMP